jgi:hypothetical protein
MPWTILGIVTRAISCCLGAFAARFVWPKSRYVVAIGLTIFLLGIDICSVLNFHVRQPADDASIGSIYTPVALKLAWLAIYFAANLGGSLMGEASGATVQQWCYRVWTNAPSSRRNA